MLLFVKMSSSPTLSDESDTLLSAEVNVIPKLLFGLIVFHFSLQELQGLIDEANQSLEESGTPSHEIMVIVLHREFTAGSIGITLAGGADYESKDITVSSTLTKFLRTVFNHVIFVL